MLDAYYKKYKVKIDIYTYLTILYGQIETNRQLLLPLGGKQGTDDTGIAEETSEAKIALVLEILQNAGPAASKFHHLGKKALSILLSFSYSDLIRMRPEILIQTSNTVVNTCTTNITDLTGTGVTIISLAKVTDAKEAYQPEVNASRIAIRDKTVVTVDISATISENQDIINNQLKGGMMVFMVTEKTMHAEFLKMIELPHEGVHSHHAPQGPKAIITINAVNDENSETLENVSVKIVGTRKTFKTDSSGMLAANILLGPGMGKAEKEGFVLQNFVFTLTDKGLVITIRMVPITA